MNTPALIIDGLNIPVQLDPEHEYTLPTSSVAAGYGVSDVTIRRHKNEHSDELVAGKHFISVSNPHANGDSTGVQNLNARQKGLKRGSDTVTLWTKRGIVRLGFFIKSERAKRFRDMAEDLVIRVMEKEVAPTSLESSISALAIQIGRLADAITSHVEAPAPQVYSLPAPVRPDYDQAFYDRLLAGKPQRFTMKIGELASVAEAVDFPDFPARPAHRRLRHLCGDKAWQSSVGKIFRKLFAEGYFRSGGQVCWVQPKASSRGSIYHFVIATPQASQC